MKQRAFWPRLLLLSNGLTTPALQQALLKLSTVQPQVARVVVIPTSRLQGNDDDIAQHTDCCLRHLGYRSIVWALQYSHVAALASADVIVITGGDPFKLLAGLRTSAMGAAIIAAARRGAVIVGISAGGVVLADTMNHVYAITNSSQPRNASAQYQPLHITTSLFVPHWNSPDFNSRDPLLTQFEKHGKPHRTVHRLLDNQGLVVTNQSTITIGV